MANRIWEDFSQKINITSRELIRNDGPQMPPGVFGVSVAREMDNMIRWEDAISIAFLIVDKREVGLELCRNIERQKKNDVNGAGCGIMELIFLSLERKGNTSWPLIVFQTLYLVGHKRLLYDLGMEVEQVGKVLEEGHKIKCERRLLYSLIENMDSSEHGKLVQILKDNGRLDNMEEMAEMMEVVLFHLLEGRGVEEVCQLVVETLQGMKRADLETFYSSQVCSSSSCSVHRRRGPASLCYEQGEGLCVIINQKLFKQGSNLDNRLGTDRDKEELKITFTLLGVQEEDMMVYDDLTAADIRQKLGICSEKTNQKNYAWLTVVVLSHGRRVAGVDEVLGVDGEGIDRREIVGKFTDPGSCPNLQFKPKMFFFQACRGREELESSNPSQFTGNSGDRNSDTADQHSDVLIASSTIADFVAFRSTVDGSFFIRHLCQVFQDHAQEETLQDMLLRVNDKVSNYRKLDFPSTPEYNTTMKKKFKFLVTQENKERFQKLGFSPYHSWLKAAEMKLKVTLFNRMLNDFVLESARS